MLRLNVNIAIVAMVNFTAIPHTNVTIAEECGYFETNRTGEQMPAAVRLQIGPNFLKIQLPNAPGAKRRGVCMG